MEEISGGRSDGQLVLVEETLPVVEIILDKNKATGQKKTLFYRLEPMSGRMEKCSPMEQRSLQTALEALSKDRAAKATKSCSERRG